MEAALRSYELMYILDPTLDEDASKALVGKIEDLMTKQGVEIEKTEPWGKRRLAYRVKGHWEGNYILSYLKAAPAVVSEMERRLRVTDGVLRYLTVRIDEEQAKLERRKAREEVKDQARRERRGVRATEPRKAPVSSMGDYDSMSDDDDMEEED
jgi:small subunit ribosomal protein S6